MRCIVAAIGFWIFAVSPALAFYQQTFLFQKWVFVDAEKPDQSNASKKVDRQAKKWRIAFTNPMS
ncbi:MAG: hypothetical protein OEU92_14450 [Alphaproteobacteria bacterium]|nr:hypothetical protein [Alphaproteobacteria bacterium]